MNCGVKGVREGEVGVRQWRSSHLPCSPGGRVNIHTKTEAKSKRDATKISQIFETAQPPPPPSETCIHDPCAIALCVTQLNLVPALRVDTSFDVGTLHDVYCLYCGCCATLGQSFKQPAKPQREQNAGIVFIVVEDVEFVCAASPTRHSAWSSPVSLRLWT
jgi:hypothetical protein